jgi:biotin transport system substrate-specific component
MLQSNVINKTIYRAVLTPFFLAFGIIFLGKVSILTPFSPVPLAFRPQLVILFAWLFGFRNTCAALLIFLIAALQQNACLVSSSAFANGVFGPTCGYIFGYFVVAYLVRFLQKIGLSPLACFALSSLTIDFLGAAWMSIFFGVEKSMQIGFMPFILADMVKSVVFASALSCFSCKAGSEYR